METELPMLTAPPEIAVGLLQNIAAASFTLHAPFRAADGTSYAAGKYAAVALPTAGIRLTDPHGRTEILPGELLLEPLHAETRFTLHEVTIGIAFHWERREDQQFKGKLLLRHHGAAGLLVINRVEVETYLASVIASEMSATAHPELLKAHAIISRSWLLAQLPAWKPALPEAATLPAAALPANTEAERIRWYDRENHAAFDICADDHCQRYQGVGKVLTETVAVALAATRGIVLTHNAALCDARFSKCCGGFTELFASAWQAVDVPYLQAFYDGERFPTEYALPLAEEANAQRWILGAPPAFCSTSDATLLQRILPDFDQETTDFYRWRVTLTQTELQALLQQKIDWTGGAVLALEPLARGASGRLTRLRIRGERATLVIGKELEIRRALSASHLYSSAFVIEAQHGGGAAPTAFVLRGAGWGHGVGLCQLGAAVMAERGYTFAQILAHYYCGAQLQALYA